MPPQPSFSSFAATASKSAPSPWTGTLRLRAVRDVHRPHLRRLACEWPSTGRTTRTRCSFLARFDLLEHESLHWLVCQAERCRLLNCPIHIPTVHKNPLDEPHPGGSAAACSMNERGFHSRRPHRLQEGVHDAWVGLRRAKRNMNVRDAGGFCGGGCRLDICALLAR